MLESEQLAFISCRFGAGGHSMIEIAFTEMNVAGPYLFPAKCASLEPISELVEQAARLAGLDDQATGAIQLAVEEACDNIIEHAYGPDIEGDIECTFEIVAEGLVVTLHDHGRSFDPRRVSPPDLTSALEQRDVGGLGLHFIRQLTDDFRFAFDPLEGNSLRLLKRRSQNGSLDLQGLELPRSCLT